MTNWSINDAQPLGRTDTQRRNHVLWQGRITHGYAVARSSPLTLGLTNNYGTRSLPIQRA